MKPLHALLTTPLLLAALLVATDGNAGPERTTLSGRVLDPISDAPIAGVLVRLGNRTATTNADGSFSLRLPRRKASHVATSFEAPGYRVYRTWTETGTETEREVYLFPDRDVTIPGIPGRSSDVISREVFEEHFNVVHRNAEQVHSRLTRWGPRPRIHIVDHVVEWRDNRLLATAERLPRLAVRRLRKEIRDSVATLTADAFELGRVRLRRVRPGEVLRDSPSDYTHGELPLYGSYQLTGGAAHVENHAIVFGEVYIQMSTLTRAAEQYRGGVIVHEFGHALGMLHPATYPNQYRHGTPVLSIMSYPDPLLPVGTGGYEITPMDVVTARIAHSRLPGNDWNDRDPDPRDTARRPSHVLWSHGRPPWAPEAAHR